MGNGGSFQTRLSFGRSSFSHDESIGGEPIAGGTPTQWKVLPGTKELAQKLIQEGTINEGALVIPEHRELRALLDDPLGQKYVGMYAKKCHTQEAFFVWIDAQEYREIPTPDYRRGKALHIYQKYIKPNAVLELGGIEPQWREEIKSCLDRAWEDPDALGEDLFDRIRQHAFLVMYHNTFLRFKASSEYDEMKKLIKDTYNKVDADDFVYLEHLGEGGFGKVVHVMKKSTDSHCAMKIQLKTAMLDCFSDDPKRIDHERRVLASVHHPFILGLQYAFQTETLAILVLEMVTCGDLQEALDKSGSNGLGEERAAFYCAEIILALIHLHDMGLMYRDLKPCNVMLCDDGHIKLADMGGVAEFAEGTVLEDYDPSDVSSTPYSTVVGTLKQQSTNEDLQHKRRHRRRSIMGTHGYMAPEMVILANQPRSVRKGYTKSVDYWSLGVTLYKFLTTVRPFDRKAFEAFVQDPDCRMGKGFQKYQDILDAMRYPIPVTDAAHSVIVGLLQGNEHERLGCTPELLKALRSHPFFCGIDWVKLSMRQVIPPYIPEPRQLNENPTVPDFKTLMKEYEAQSKSGKRHADEFNWAEAPRQSDQVYFSNWDYVSMHTLKIEMGIANEMRELDNNLKVRKMVGSDDDIRKLQRHGTLFLTRKHSRLRD